MLTAAVSMLLDPALALQVNDAWAWRPASALHYRDAMTSRFSVAAIFDGPASSSAFKSVDLL